MRYPYSGVVQQTWEVKSALWPCKLYREVQVNGINEHVVDAAIEP
jgi:hypothetical protein